MPSKFGTNAAPSSSSSLLLVVWNAFDPQEDGAHSIKTVKGSSSGQVTHEDRMHPCVAS